MELIENHELFRVGSVFPPTSHQARIERYRYNKELFKGEHLTAFHKHHQYKGNLRVAVGLPSLIVKKSADFLFGEAVAVLSGKGEGSKEQHALDRIVAENHLNTILYESALSNAYNGDAFIKVRFGQKSGGVLPYELDPSRVIIENLNAEYVFPEFSKFDKSVIEAYHYAIPHYDSEKKQWGLMVETHRPNEIIYSQYQITPMNYDCYGEVTTFTIQSKADLVTKVVTGVPVPLIVHIPNFSTADTWQGLDDLTELHPLFDELNNRLTQVAQILDKHSDPALAVPTGLLGTDEDGSAQFRVAVDKVFEVLGKDDIIPQYITWDASLQSAFTEIDKLISLILATAELPEIALGMGDSGTSGASGLAIKWRMNSLLSKINRKRQYYEKGLKQVFYIAQKLEQAVGVADYELVIPHLEFHDGLPTDEMEQANIASIRTGGAKTLSQKSAIMRLNNMTEEQAEREMERIRLEEKASLETAEPSIFNVDTGLED